MLQELFATRESSACSNNVKWDKLSRTVIEHCTVEADHNETHSHRHTLIIQCTKCPWAIKCS